MSHYGLDHRGCDYCGCHMANGCGYHLCTDDDCARVRADEDEDAAKEREASDE